MAVSCDVLASATLQIPAEELPTLRRQPGPTIRATLPANFLKHSDDQSVAGLAVVLRAIEKGSLQGTDFTAWGIVAAPQFLGRATLVSALQRFAAEGAWGMSPHFIPHRTQHAVAGTISQALKIHGPNFGTGGGRTSTLEALLAGAVMVEGSRLPGAWIVLTGWDPELIPDREGNPTASTLCRAVAMALVAPRPAWRGPRLRVLPGRGDKPALIRRGAAAPSLAGLEAFLTACEMTETRATAVVWELEGGGRLELEQAGVVAGEGERKGIGGRLWTRNTQIGAGTENKR
jgi:hypothetical protein